MIDCRLHRLREPPAQDFARRPVYDPDQIQEPLPHWYKSDVGAPDLVRLINLHLSQQIRIDWILGRRLAGSGAFVDRLQPYRRHQSSDVMTTDNCGLSS